MKMAALDKVNKSRPRTVVITQGKEPALVVKGIATAPCEENLFCLPFKREERYKLEVLQAGCFQTLLSIVL